MGSNRASSNGIQGRERQASSREADCGKLDSRSALSSTHETKAPTIQVPTNSSRHLTRAGFSICAGRYRRRPMQKPNPPSYERVEGHAGNMSPKRWGTGTRTEATTTGGCNSIAPRRPQRQETSNGNLFWKSAIAPVGGPPSLMACLKVRINIELDGHLEKLASLYLTTT